MYREHNYYVVTFNGEPDFHRNIKRRYDPQIQGRCLPDRKPGSGGNAGIRLAAISGPGSFLEIIRSLLLHIISIIISQSIVMD